MERLLAEIETEKNKFSDSLLKQVNLTDISNAMRQTQKRRPTFQRTFH